MHETYAEIEYWFECELFIVFDGPLLLKQANTVLHV